MQLGGIVVNVLVKQAHADIGISLPALVKCQRAPAAAYAFLLTGGKKFTP